MYRTNDSLYSLYVVSNEPESGETLHPVLREISVPDSDEYPERVVDISSVYAGDQEGSGVNVIDLIMDEFKAQSKTG